MLIVVTRAECSTVAAVMMMNHMVAWKKNTPTALSVRMSRTDHGTVAACVGRQDPSTRAASRSSEACSRSAVVARARAKRFSSVSWVQS